MFGPTGERLRGYIIGGVLIAVSLLVVYLALTVQSGVPFAATTTVSAAIDDVGGMKVGDQVREHSARVGKVSDISYQDGHAIVTMQLDGHVPVYADANAQVWDFSALASKFVELSRGTPGAGPLGDRAIPASRNVNSADLYQLLDVFDAPTRDKLDSFINGVGGGSLGHGPDFHALVGAAPSLLTDLSTTSDALTADPTALPRLFQSTNEISFRFVNRRGQIADLIHQTDQTFEGISVDNARPLSDSLQHLPSTLDHAHTSFVALDKPLAHTQSAFDRLRPGGQSLGEATPDFRGFLRGSRSPLDKVPGVSDDAKPAVSDMSDTFSDLRPLAPRVAETFDRLRTPLDLIKPYSKEFGYLFVRLHSFVSESSAPGVHFARVNATIGPDTLLNSAVRDKYLLPHDPYPAPGAGTFERNGPHVQNSGGNR